MVSYFRVVEVGDLSRGEHLNLAVIAYEGNENNPELLMQFTENLPRISDTFNMSIETILHITNRIAGLKTKADLDYCMERMTPYTPFQFTEPATPSLTSAKETLDSVAAHFLKK